MVIGLRFFDLSAIIYIMITSDPKNPGTREWLERYTDALLGAAELADTLDSRSLPEAKDSFFRISNPLIINAVRLPIALEGYTLRSIVIAFRTNVVENRPYISPEFIYEFMEGEARVRFSDHELQSYPIDFIAAESTYISTSPDGISRDQLSQTLAGILRPGDDASRSGDQDLSTPQTMEDVSMLLQDSIFVERSEVSTYMLDGHEIVISRENGKVTEVSIQQVIDTDDNYSIAMRISYEKFSHSIEVFRVDRKSSEEIPADENEVAAFGDIIADLLEELSAQQPEVSYEQHVENVLDQEATHKKTPEERHGGGGKTPI